MSQNDSPFPPPSSNGGRSPQPTTGFGAPLPAPPSNRSKRELWPVLIAMALLVPIVIAGIWYSNRTQPSDTAEQTSGASVSVTSAPDWTVLPNPATPVSSPLNTLLTIVPPPSTTTPTTSPPTTTVAPAPTTEPTATVATEAAATGSSGGVATDPTATLSTDSAPQLLYSVPINRVESPVAREPTIAGSPDDFYVAEAGTDKSTVTRFVNGEVAWQSEVGQDTPVFLDLIGDRIIVSTHPSSTEFDSEVVGIDTETGVTEWIVRTNDPTELRVHDGRYYLLRDYGAGGVPGEVIELDIVDGTVLNRWVGSSVYPVEIGYGSWNEASSKAQLLDFDLKPVGDPVAIEASFYSLPSFDRSEAGWVYLVMGEPRRGQPKLITLSPEGERRNECDFSTNGARAQAWTHARFVGPDTVAALGLNSVEVFDISGSTCTTLWNLPTTVGFPNQERWLLTLDPLVVLTFPVGQDGEISQTSYGARVEVLDWRTGEPVATGTDDLIVQSNGLVVTHDDRGIVARILDSGEERWHIDTEPNSEVVVVDAMLGIVTYDGGTATLNIYAG